MAVGFLFEPGIELQAHGPGLGAELAAEIPSQGAERPTQLEAPEQSPQLIVRRLEQVRADVTKEVEVTSQHGDLQGALRHELAARLDHGAAEVAHDRAGVAEVCGDLVQPR